MEITKELIVEQLDKLIAAHWYWAEFSNGLSRVLDGVEVYEGKLYENSQEEYDQLIFKMLKDYSPVDFDKIEDEVEDIFFDMLYEISHMDFYVFRINNDEAIKVTDGEDIYNIFNKPEYWGIF